MEIKFNSDILTANTSKREITGIIVPFGRPGFTNMGTVVFEQGYSVRNFYLAPCGQPHAIRRQDRRPTGRQAGTGGGVRTIQSHLC